MGRRASEARGTWVGPLEAASWGKLSACGAWTGRAEVARKGEGWTPSCPLLSPTPVLTSRVVPTCSLFCRHVHHYSFICSTNFYLALL